MDFRVIIEASRKAPELAAFNQTRQCLINRGASSDTKEITRRENAATPAGAGALHDLIRY